ncbi:MAG: 4-alpha-glucanotransferase [Gemmatimonadaceae bacterium]
MKFPRASGVLLHPTSLPGPGGVGTLGADALGFLDFMRETGFSIWQVLPLGPTGFGDSPYQCYSAFAGNPLLISLPVDAATTASGASKAAIVDVDFGAVIPEKRRMLREHFKRFVPDARYERWVQQQPWLEDFALFSALKDAHGGNSWTSWDAPLAQHDVTALQKFANAHKHELAQVRFEQYVFFRQFEALRRACAERAIKLMGDVPIYVAHDSADVWGNRELFELDADGALLTQAGVPPDYFSETGQLWGNPIYKWETLRKQGYKWWIDRMRAALSMFDIVRLDHFRGFEAYWEVPGNATTAINGRWAPGPGADLFNALTEALGPLPIVAENLGLITPEVEELREQFGYPGMSILQFAFAGDGQGNEFKPHLFPHERVVYTGTHDNDTTLGWWNSSAGEDSTRTAAEIEKEHAYARRYLDTEGDEMNWTLIRAALASVADTVLIPMQDILGLGSDARMNLPGRQSGNWKFRFDWKQLTPDITRRLRDLNSLFDRRSL